MCHIVLVFFLGISILLFFFFTSVKAFTEYWLQSLPAFFFFFFISASVKSDPSLFKGKTFSSASCTVKLVWKVIINCNVNVSMNSQMSNGTGVTVQCFCRAMKPLCFQSLKTLFRKSDMEIVLYLQQKWNINCQYKGVYVILALNSGSSILYFLVFFPFRADRVRPLSEGTKALHLSNKSNKNYFLDMMSWNKIASLRK